MHYPWWYVPHLTSPMLIAAIAVVHVLVSHYAVGGGLFLGSGEWINRWRLRLAQESVPEGVPAHRQLAWRPTLADIVAAVSEAFEVEPADVLVSRRHGNEARSAAIYLARRVADEAVGAIARYFGGVSSAAISKVVSRVEDRCAGDRGWDARLAKLRERLRTSGDSAKS
jgi:hypothetical protein